MNDTNSGRRPRRNVMHWTPKGVCKVTGNEERKFYKRIPCKFDLGSFYKEILCIHLNGNPLYFFDFILQGNPFDFFTKEFPEKFYREILLLFFDF